MTRQSVAKHLAVLEGAGLVTTLWRGREKLHFLNAAPLQDVADRWIRRYHREHARALADLKRTLEEPAMSETAFVYATYVRTTPETLWRALTEPAFTERYWGVALQSDWQVGSPVLMRMGPGDTFRDHDMRVLAAEPHRLLSYGWHGFQPEHAAHFGWSAERLAELVRERRSRVTFELERLGEVVKLTLVHDGFDPGSEMLRAVSGRMPGSGGWPELLSGLKTLLETGEVLTPA